MGLEGCAPSVAEMSTARDARACFVRPYDAPSRFPRADHSAWMSAEAPVDMDAAGMLGCRPGAPPVGWAGGWEGPLSPPRKAGISAMGPWLRRAETGAEAPWLAPAEKRGLGAGWALIWEGGGGGGADARGPVLWCPDGPWPGCGAP